MNALKSAYGNGHRFGRIATPIMATRAEKRRVLLSCTCPLWMGPVERFCWRQGMRAGVGVISLFSLFRAMGW